MLRVLVLIFSSFCMKNGLFAELLEEDSNVLPNEQLMKFVVNTPV